MMIQNNQSNHQFLHCKLPTDTHSRSCSERRVSIRHLGIKFGVILFAKAQLSVDIYIKNMNSHIYFSNV